MARYYPEITEFEKLAEPGRTIPVYRQLLSDTLTPVSAYRRLSDADHAFLLESVVGGEQVARYSFLGAGPTAVFRAKGNSVETTRQGLCETTQSVDPLSNLEQLLASYHGIHLPGLPRFTGGAVGYASYDMIRYYEGESLPNPPHDDRDLPDLPAHFCDEDLLSVLGETASECAASVWTRTDAGGVQEQTLRTLPSETCRSFPFL